MQPRHSIFDFVTSAQSTCAGYQHAPMTPIVLLHTSLHSMRVLKVIPGPGLISSRTAPRSGPVKIDQDRDYPSISGSGFPVGQHSHRSAPRFSYLNGPESAFISKISLLRPLLDGFLWAGIMRWTSYRLLHPVLSAAQSTGLIPNFHTPLFLLGSGLIDE